VVRMVRRFIGIGVLIVVIAGCGLWSSGEQTQPTFVAVAPANPTATPEDLPVETVMTEQPQETAVPPASPTAETESVPGLVETAPPETSQVSFPDPRKYEWRLVTSGLNRPVGLVNAGDGSRRLFVLEQEGVIRVIRDGELQAEPFLDIRDRVGSNANEQGLLGLAFHPDYMQNGFFYVDYTDRNGNTVIARFSVSDDPNQADADSEKRLLGIEQPYSNHNGGAMAFGPDGYLYIGTGDGGSGGDPQGNAQSLDTLLGKVLRLDVDGGDPYSIPAGNLQAEIWAYGLRNPWRFSFDGLTGDLYIGDVGQGTWEEIDFWPAGSPGGANFGWNYREGAHPYEGSPPEGLQLVEPVAEYDHSVGVSVTGGVVYRGEVLPEFYGIYLYGDYGSGRVWGLLRNPDGSWQNQLLFESGANITSFGQDQAGEVYVVDHGGAVLVLAAKD
jgi:glucose/arabinose dehydrogenase